MMKYYDYKKLGYLEIGEVSSCSMGHNCATCMWRRDFEEGFTSLPSICSHPDCREGLYTADRETGTVIERVYSIDAGLSKIAAYEADDLADGTYEEDFYDIVDADRRSVLRG